MQRSHFNLTTNIHKTMSLIVKVNTNGGCLREDFNTLPMREWVEGCKERCLSDIAEHLLVDISSCGTEVSVYSVNFAEFGFVHKTLMEVFGGDAQEVRVIA